MKYKEIFKKWHFWLIVFIIGFYSLFTDPNYGSYSFYFLSLTKFLGSFLGVFLIYSIVLFVYKLKKKKE